MTDGEAFLLVFVLIYLSDCLVWLPPSGFAAVSFWRRRFFLKRAAVNFDALRKGFAVLNPLPPFGTMFVSSTWPVSFTAEGLAPFSRENPNPGSTIGPVRDAKYTIWEDIDRITSHEHTLKVNGHPYALCSSRAAARLLARDLNLIRALPADSRAEAIDKIVRHHFRERNAGKRAAFFRSATGPLRTSAIVLFALVFFLVPYAYWRFQDTPRFFFVLLAAWLMMLQISIEFFRLHQRFYPSLRGERWQHLLFALVFPHYAIRSLDVLSKGFLADSHPLAIAAALTPDDELARITNFMIRDARHPIPLSNRGAGFETAENFRIRHFVPALEKTVARLGLPDSQKETTEEDYKAECPRCGTAYQRAEIPCSDCDGIETVVPNTAQASNSAAKG